jgi:hypothetical protein
MVVLPASAFALTRTVYKTSSSGHLAAQGAWDEQYTLLAYDNIYYYARRFRDCYRINDTAIRCWWTRGQTPTDQAYNTRYWECVTDKDHSSGSTYRYQTNCVLYTVA